MQSLFDFLDDTEYVMLLTSAMLPLRRRRQRQAAPKVDNFAKNVLPLFTSRDFRQHFRVSKTVFEKLHRKLDPHLKYDFRTMGKQPLSPRKQLLIYMWYIANQDALREIGNMFRVSRSTVHKVVRRVSKCICNNLKQSMIRWPDEQR